MAIGVRWPISDGQCAIGIPPCVSGVAADVESTPNGTFVGSSHRLAGSRSQNYQRETYDVLAHYSHPSPTAGDAPNRFTLLDVSQYQQVKKMPTFK
jgi:hypothetical protein